MKTSELMIGDLLYLNRRPVRVDAIGFNGSISYSEKGGFGGIGIDKLSPIPITNEILVKNGFVRSQRWHYCTMRTSDDFRICVQFKCGGGVDYITIMKHFNDLINRDVDVALSIHYVHQLQHLFRLCGIEKELTI